MDENLSSREVKQAQAAPDLETKVLAAINAHPSKKRRDDGSFSFSRKAYDEIAQQCGVAPEQVSRIALKAGIVRRPTVAKEEPEPKPHIGAAAKAVKTKQLKAQNAQIITLFAVGFHSLYSVIGQFDGKHWELEEDEADDLAGALKQALDTLEGEEYERAIQLLSKAAPWAALGAAVWSVTRPRLEQSRANRATAKAAASAGSGGTNHRRAIGGGEDSRAYSEQSFAPSPLGSDEPDGRTDFPPVV